MHDRAVAGSRWTAVARLRRRHAQHRRLPRPPRRRGRLCDGAGRRSLERGDAGGLARRGCRHRPRRARAGQAAGALSHRHRRRRPAPLLLLARQRAGAAAVRPAADARDRGRARPLRPRLSVGGHPVALRRGRARPAARRPRHAPAPAAAASPSTPTFAPAAGRTARWPGPPSARRSRAPTSCWPPPRTSSCCSARTAWPSCRPAILGSRSCSSWRSRRLASSWAAPTRPLSPSPCADVVDTTAAGDSFAAAYLAARLAGADVRRRRRDAGHRLAGAVVRHRGAVIPRSAMPAAILPSLEVRP